jgi:hypothetical protein
MSCRDRVEEVIVGRILSQLVYAAISKKVVAHRKKPGCPYVIYLVNPIAVFTLK